MAAPRSTVSAAHSASSSSDRRDLDHAHARHVWSSARPEPPDAGARHADDRREARRHRAERASTHDATGTGSALEQRIEHRELADEAGKRRKAGEHDRAARRSSRRAAPVAAGMASPTSSSGSTSSSARRTPRPSPRAGRRPARVRARRARPAGTSADARASRRRGNTAPRR